jgi:hypothetical protein
MLGLMLAESRIRLFFPAYFLASFCWEITRALTWPTPGEVLGQTVAFALLLCPLFALLGATAFWAGWRSSRHTYPLWYVGLSSAVALGAYIAAVFVVSPMRPYTESLQVWPPLAALAFSSYVLGLKGTIEHVLGRHAET